MYGQVKQSNSFKAVHLICLRLCAACSAVCVTQAVTSLVDSEPQRTTSTGLAGHVGHPLGQY